MNEKKRRGWAQSVFECVLISSDHWTFSLFNWHFRLCFLLFNIFVFCFVDLSGDRCFCFCFHSEYSVLECFLFLFCFHVVASLFLLSQIKKFFFVILQIYKRVFFFHSFSLLFNCREWEIVRVCVCVCVFCFFSLIFVGWVDFVSFLFESWSCLFFGRVQEFVIVWFSFGRICLCTLNEKKFFLSSRKISLSMKGFFRGEMLMVQNEFLLSVIDRLLGQVNSLTKKQRAKFICAEKENGICLRSVWDEQRLNTPIQWLLLSHSTLETLPCSHFLIVVFVCFPFNRCFNNWTKSKTNLNAKKFPRNAPRKQQKHLTEIVICLIWWIFHFYFSTNQNSRKNQIQLVELLHIGIDGRVNSDSKKIIFLLTRLSFPWRNAREDSTFH